MCWIGHLSLKPFDTIVLWCSPEGFQGFPQLDTRRYSLSDIFSSLIFGKGIFQSFFPGIILPRNNIWVFISALLRAKDLSCWYLDIIHIYIYPNMMFICIIYLDVMYIYTYWKICIIYKIYTLHIEKICIIYKHIYTYIYFDVIYIFLHWKTSILYIYVHILYWYISIEMLHWGVFCQRINSDE